MATVVRDCLSFVAVDKIARAVQADPENSLWMACTCQACAGRQLEWIHYLRDRDEQQAAAFGHALEILFDLRDHLVSPALNPKDRQLSWREHCGAALARYDELHDAGQEWPTAPNFLRQWFNLPVPSRTAS
ncbi:hypothetical protein ACQPWY_25805 [Pseudonocardia xinjiangensis]|uniref:hypothetical protein n=1 Tax=Pseudonocardia xinjiangensis TaxID=75289 RepID=UPI003D950443